MATATPVLCRCYARLQRKSDTPYHTLFLLQTVTYKSNAWQSAVRPPGYSHIGWPPQSTRLLLLKPTRYAIPYSPTVHFFDCGDSGWGASPHVPEARQLWEDCRYLQTKFYVKFGCFVYVRCNQCQTLYMHSVLQQQMPSSHLSWCLPTKHLTVANNKSGASRYHCTQGWRS